MQDTTTTLVIAVVANVANLAIELLFVYALDLGIAGFGVGHGPRPVRRRARLPPDRRPCRAPGRRLAAPARGRSAEQRPRREPAGRAHGVAARRAAHGHRDRVAHQRRRGRCAADLRAGAPLPRTLARRAGDRRPGDGRALPRRLEHRRRTRGVAPPDRTGRAGRRGLRARARGGATVARGRCSPTAPACATSCSRCW